MADNELIEQGSRPMPDFVKRGLVRVSGNIYLRAAYRVLWMRHEHAAWSIVSSVVHADYAAGYIVMQATIMDEEGRVLATAHAEGKRDKLPLVESTETAAIARALGLCGYGTEFGQDEEIGLPEVGTGVAEPGVKGGPTQVHINLSDAPCAECHAPPQKRHTAACKLAKA